MTTVSVSSPINLYRKGDSAYLLAVDGGYTGTLEDFEADLISAVESVDQSAASAAAALVSEQNAKASELLADADATQTALDRIQTGADRTQTGLDRIATAADRVQTGLDRTATGQDKIATNADVVLTNADVVLTHADVILTHADAAQTALDRIATGQDKIATAADRVQTGADRSQTGADRAQTGLDVISAGQSATNAMASQTAAKISEDLAYYYALQLIAQGTAKGTWNATTNTPTLANGTGTTGWWYMCAVGGTQLGYTWNPGDVVFYNGSAWIQIPSYKSIASFVETLTGVETAKFITPELLYLFTKSNNVPYQNAVDDLNMGAFNIACAILTATTVNATTVTGTTLQTTLNKTTIEGGIAVRLTNKTGGASVKGTVVAVSSTTDSGFMNNPIDGDMPIGIVYETGIADGSLCWVVIAGIAEVLLRNTVAGVRSYVAYSSATTAGRIDIASSVPSSTTHFREVGHTIESKTAGTDVLIKCLLHFN